MPRLVLYGSNIWCHMGPLYGAIWANLHDNESCFSGWQYSPSNAMHLGNFSRTLSTTSITIVYVYDAYLYNSTQCTYTQCWREGGHSNG